MNEEKIKAIQDCPKPRNLTHLREFVGHCNYYRRFVDRLSQLATPLTNLTKKEALSWSPTIQQTFDKLEEMKPCHALPIPDFSLPCLRM